MQTPLATHSQRPALVTAILALTGMGVSLMQTLVVPLLPHTRIVFRYEITNQDGLLLNTGETTLVFIKSATGRPCPAPPDLVEAIKPFFRE